MATLDRQLDVYCIKYHFLSLALNPRSQFSLLYLCSQWTLISSRAPEETPWICEHASGRAPGRKSVQRESGVLGGAIYWEFVKR